MDNIINVYDTNGTLDDLSGYYNDMKISSKDMTSFPKILNDQIYLAFHHGLNDEENVYIINKVSLESIISLFSNIDKKDKCIDVEQSTPNSSNIYIGYMYNNNDESYTVYTGYNEYKEYELTFYNADISFILEYLNNILRNVYLMENMMDRLASLDSLVKSSIKDIDHIELICDNSYLHKSFDEDFYKAFIVNPIFKPNSNIEGVYPFIYIFPVNNNQNEYLNHINHFRYDKQVEVEVIGYDRDKAMEEYNKEIQQLFQDKYGKK